MSPTSSNVWLNSDRVLAIKSDNSLVPERLNECVDNLVRGDFILLSSVLLAVSASTAVSFVDSLGKRLIVAINVCQLSNNVSQLLLVTNLDCKSNTLHEYPMHPGGYKSHMWFLLGLGICHINLRRL